MSRRPPNATAAKAAQNQATIKSLLKLEANKLCADCKRNKHPRWASWNLGIFVCIRCSGIHRGMGTHISRVKSVDLDSWTDEQLQSMLSWGNARAKKYWESKLAPDHIPSEAKIENFIRTKYELKRWAMDGDMPDPSTLDAEEDDDVPLSLVKEKQNLERSESMRKAEKTPVRKAKQADPATADLIGAEIEDPIPQRSSTAGPAASRVPPKSEAAPPKATPASKDSLLGLDFFGGQSAAPPRPASTTGTGGVSGQSRPDLKQSILSLYASSPRQQPPQPPPPSQPPGGAFGAQGSAGDLSNAFGSLSFSVPQARPSDPFASLGAGGSMAPTQPQAQSSSAVGGAFGALGAGSFFDSKPAQPAAPSSHQAQPSNSSFGDFAGFASSSSPVSTKPAQTSSLGDLFDMSAPSTQPPTTYSPPKPAPSTQQPTNSVFNLSSLQPKSSTPTAASSGTINWSASDEWGSNAWGAPTDTSAAGASASTTTSAQPKSPALSKLPSDFGGWTSSDAGAGGGGSFATQSVVPGDSGGFHTAPKVAADEEFGGWASGSATASSKKASGLGGNDDLFSNVWQ